MLPLVTDQSAEQDLALQGAWHRCADQGGQRHWQ